MLLAEKKMAEIERKNARLGTLPGDSPVECQVHQVVEPNPPLQLEMALFDKTEKTERFVNQTATARSLMSLILETTSAVKAFKGAGNTFVEATSIQASFLCNITLWVTFRPEGAIGYADGTLIAMVEKGEARVF